jgi:hypothetical protein
MSSSRTSSVVNESISDDSVIGEPVDVVEGDSIGAIDLDDDDAVVAVLLVVRNGVVVVVVVAVDVGDDTDDCDDVVNEDVNDFLKFDLFDMSANDSKSAKLNDDRCCS